MPSPLLARLPVLARLRRPRWGRAEALSFARRLVHFWVVWSALLLVHEGGHAVSAWHEGMTVSRVTIGIGPVLWRGAHDDAQLVLRLVPVAGMTSFDGPRGAGSLTGAGGSASWSRQAAVLSSGILATLTLAIGIAGLVALRERSTARRSVWGRAVVADALVLSVFNLLPVPPLDGGRALLGAVELMRGSPLSMEALFWVQAGGLALAVVPMTLWTRWTARIDAIAMRWRAPVPHAVTPPPSTGAAALRGLTAPLPEAGTGG
jgi:membrane-associated protease RseP (regulator of RpoE activity)